MTCVQINQSALTMLGKPDVIVLSFYLGRTIATQHTA